MTGNPTEGKDILVQIQAIEPTTLFSKDEPWRGYINIAESQSHIADPDVTTKKGREHIASTAYKVTRSKTALVKIGTNQTKVIKAACKEIEKKLDLVRDNVRDPLTKWEVVEKEKEEREEAERIAAEKYARDWDEPTPWPLFSMNGKRTKSYGRN